MVKKTAACRLQVLLARSAPVGVIFRRGPTQWVQVIKWNTKSDEFEPGQWFHGRLYVGRSDLSPDGSLLIYFAAKFNKKESPNEEQAYAWTAVSRPRYLSALARWPKDDCWQGGGLFTGSKDVFLNHKPEAANPDPKHLPKDIRVKPNPDARGEDDPILVPRMERDGWSFVQWLDYDYAGRHTKRPAIFEKIHKKQQLTLRVEKYHDNQNERWVCILVREDGKQHEIGIGTWADFDQQGRIVFASEGKLFCGVLENSKLALTELADFNEGTPQPVESPGWAMRW